MSKFDNPPPCGMIFEFKEMDQARAFAEAVKSRFKLDGRVFDDAKAAADSHMFPWEQYPPVVHIDRHESIDVELEIEELASKFGGDFIGT
jgi:hypothetical protein